VRWITFESWQHLEKVSPFIFLIYYSLKDMSKSELINEFLQLEHRMDTLEKRVAKASEDDHEEKRQSPPAINPEQAKKIMELQAKVIKLQKVENTKGGFFCNKKIP